MDTLGITGYGILSRSLDSGNSSSSPPKKSSGSSLDMDDFLQLLAAQFQNQDVTNPMDNTQFIAELAQFSSLQAMSQLTSYADSQYGASLVGKTVSVEAWDTSGKLVKDTGVVSAVNFSSSDGSSIIVNSKAYTLGSVVQVMDSSSGASSGSSKKDDSTDGADAPSGTNSET